MWDVTAICTTASSYIDSSGPAAEIAATRKSAKYSNLSSQHTFYPIAVETLRASFVDQSWQTYMYIGSVSIQVTVVSFLFERIYVVVQRFNAVLMHKQFC